MTADEIKSEADILPVIQDWYGVKLERRGKNYIGLCPLHDDKKTPSLSVDHDKGVFHCFGCGKGGDVIRFVMFMENLGSDGDAMKYIETRLVGGGMAHGHSVPATYSTMEAAKTADNRPQHRVPGTPESAEYIKRCAEAYRGSPGEDYMKSRGISTETATGLNVGYAADIDSILYPDSAGGFKARKINAANKDNRFRASSHGPRGIFPANARDILTTAATPIFIVEGETDALSIYEAGFNSAAIAVGSAANSSALINMIRNIESNMEAVKVPLIITFDSDYNGAGANGAKDMADSIKTKTRAVVFNASAKDAPPELDILGGEHDPNDALKANSAAFAKRITAAENMAMSMFEAARVERVGITDEDKEVALQKEANIHRVKTKRLSDVVRKELCWLWCNVLLRGELNSIQGVPNAGKSFLIAAIAAAVSSGGRLPTVSVKEEHTADAMSTIEQGKVIYITDEDAESVIAERIENLDGNLDEVIIINEGENIPHIQSDKLETLFYDFEPTLLIYDTLQVALPSNININAANEARGAFGRILHLARKHNTCVLFIQHINKKSAHEGGGHSVFYGVGSGAINGLFRAVWTLGVIPDDNGRETCDRALIKSKSNYVMGQMPAVRFSLTYADGFRWAGVDYDITTNELFGKRAVGRPGIKSDAVADCIRSMLRDGPKPAKQLHDDVIRLTNCGESTYERTRRAVGVVTEYDKQAKEYISRIAGADGG